MMGRGDELGQLRPGWLADLIVVDGDPLANIEVLGEAANIPVIVQAGRFHKRTI